jgi:hypothetical protein
MRATASFVIVASTLAAALTPQIPVRAQWEITFAQVEAAAGLSDMRAAAPETFEARLMKRSWWAGAPCLSSWSDPLERLVTNRAASAMVSLSQSRGV